MTTDHSPQDPTPQPSQLGDQNVERLLGHAYRPEVPDAAFAQRVTERLCVLAQELAQTRAQAAGPQPAQLDRLRWRLGLAMSAAAALAGIALSWHALHYQPSGSGPAEREHRSPGLAELDRLTPRHRSASPAAKPLAIGESIQTQAGQRHRVTLPDGSVLYVNQNTTAKLDAARHLTLSSGEVFVEVAPRDQAASTPFVIKTPNREVSALGTKLVVQATQEGTGVVVTQGKVQVSGLGGLLLAGQQLLPGAAALAPAPRASHVLDWTKELMAAAESPLVPNSKYAGGALLAVDPYGQEAKLSLRKYHIDVYIEDGFARTTIDQTYFNHDPWRMEGTFYFPLPPDASLSRLAMYVNGDLTEGGMAERDYARQVFETIVTRQKDPALLEWVDGSTFKMRVFPLEGRQEKRIILSYTQRLPSLYGHVSYRFPAGHNLEVVRDWSFYARVKSGTNLKAASPSHPQMKITKEGADLVLDAAETNVKVNRDVALDLYDHSTQTTDLARFSAAEHEGARYLMVRYRPQLSGEIKNQKSEIKNSAVADSFPNSSLGTRGAGNSAVADSFPNSSLGTRGAGSKNRRDWVFLFESSADRDPLLARAQIDVIATLLANAEHDDTFAILTAGTRVHTFPDNRGLTPPARPVPVTPENVKAAVAFLEGSHLVGALDLSGALDAAKPYLEAGQNPYLVHVGSGMATLGERREDLLLKHIPDGVHYVGVGVGRRWGRSFMKAAAERTGGYFTQINPDEPVSWRAFDLLATLNTPRLLDVKVVDNAERAVFLSYASSLAQGEELCAVARIAPGERGASAPCLPQSLTITGTLDGKPFRQVVPVKDVAEHADYLPRTWAKLEIERLLAENAVANKDKIAALSKAMYVMTPFTSLLVLENEEMYKQYNVDRGRKDHWAMYPCPQKIPVVYEPMPGEPADVRNAPRTGPTNQMPSAEQVLQTILVWGHGDLGGDVVSAELWNSVGYFPPARGLVVKGSSRIHTNIGGISLVPRSQVAFSARSKNLAFGSWDRTLRLWDVATGRNEFGPPVLSNIPYMSRLFKTDSQEDQPLMGVVLLRRGEALGSIRSAKNQVWVNELRRVDTVVDKKVRGSMGIDTLPFGSDLLSWRASLTPRNLDVVDLDWDDPIFPLPLYRDRPEKGGIYAAGEFLFYRQSKWLPRIPKDELTRRRMLAFANLMSQARYEDGYRLNLEPPGPPRTFILESEAAVQERIRQKGSIVISGNEVTRDNVILRHIPRYLYQIITTGDANDPNRRVHELLNQSEDLRQIEQQWERIWFTDQPSHLTPERVHGGLEPPDDGAAGVSDNPLLYRRPSFTFHERLLYDLVSYAPGMNTSQSDILAVLEAETSPDSQSAPGAIDPAARKLISKARDAGWQALTIPAERGLPTFNVVFDGSGRYAYERVLPEGLRERVVCDGKTLLHLYPELGIGARRSVSRFHRADFARLVPWILLPVEDLARGADLKCVDERTVAILPRGAGSTKGAAGKPVTYGCIHLVFAKSGQLAERRLVEMPSGKILLRETYDNGLVKLLDGKGKELAKEQWTLQAAQAPDLNPDTKPLVVLPLPLRTREHVQQAFKIDANKRYGDLFAEAALALFAADVAEQNGAQALEVFRQRFRARKHQRLGFATLLATVSSDFQATRAELWGASQPSEPLAKYLAFALNPQRRSQEMGKIGGDGLLSRLAAFHDLYYHCQPETARDFVRNNSSSWLGWAALMKLKDADGSPKTQTAVAELCPLFDKFPGLAYAARYERADSLLRSGQRQEAQKAFRDLYEKTLKAGVLPPIDNRFRQTLLSTDQSSNEWAKLMRQTAASLVAEKQRTAVIALASQCWQLGDQPMAEEVFTYAFKDLPDQERSLTSLLGISYLCQTGKFGRANTLLRSLLTDQKFARQASLWRFGAALAARRGIDSDLVSYLDKALELEYEHLPDVIDVEAVRSDYGILLEHYQKLADAMRTLRAEPPDDFAARVIRAADHWRSLDSDGSGACQAAAQILATLGATDMAWEYYTTAQAQQANEAAPWLSLAQTLRGRGESVLADRAYAQAFTAEPTNAQILWDRALYLQQTGQFAQARQLFRQLADGKWDARFNEIQGQARKRVQGL